MEKPLDKRAVEILKRLYEAPEGLPFKELGIDDETFTFLFEGNYFSEPREVKRVKTDYGKQIVCKGYVKIGIRGISYIEHLIVEKKKERNEIIGFSITTIIAIITLVVSIILELAK